MTTTIQSPEVRTTWQFDTAHTNIEFAVRHMMIATVKGRFADFEGVLQLDEQDLTRSTVEVSIDAASLDTRNEQRDGHLRSGDFFDVERFPRLTFRSSRIERQGEDRFRVYGDLTIRDETREVVLEAEQLGRARSPWGQDVVAFRASTTLDREEFGLTWNQALETGGILVGKEVRISLEVEAVQSS